MPSISTPRRPVGNTLALLLLWIAFYASFSLFTPALLDDADSVHAEVAHEMLLRRDSVTLYANGIRYLEKAPLLYWAMAATIGLAQILGHTSARALAVAARIPLALTVLALAYAVEAFARRAFHTPGQNTTGTRAGLYAALILLSSPGIFLFTRILLPDAMLCLWLTLAMLCFWLTEQPTPQLVILSGANNPRIPPEAPQDRVPHVRRAAATMGLRLLCYAFAACCALAVLTKGLIGIVFPAAIVAIYLLLTRGPRGAIRRISQLHPLTSTAVFLAIAAPWHILIALANPAHGHPGNLTFTLHTAAGTGHWQVPLPTDGNVHGWAWFYFVNEQFLRYLNLRVPRDYDTVPLGLFWGLCLIWLMPWSPFLFHALADAARSSFATIYRRRTANQTAAPIHLLVLLWALLPLLFFSFSTRQEYYVLPALPPLTILIAAWLAQTPSLASQADKIRRAALRCTAVLVALGAIFATAALLFLLHTRARAPSTDLAALLQQNPANYALSMGHFLDLDAQALALFRFPLALAAASLFLGPLASYLLLRRNRSHAATLCLATGAFGFLLAAHLGLQTFAPVLSSQQLAADLAPQLRAGNLIVIHQEYEYASTLGFYLQRPTYIFPEGRALASSNCPPFLLQKRPSDPPLGQNPGRGSSFDHQTCAGPIAVNPIHILTDATYNGTPNYGRSSNLWYGSFFPDAPHIFETPQSLAAKWPGPQRIFLWQDLANQPSPLPAALSPVFIIARSGGKEILSNQPTHLLTH